MEREGRECLRPDLYSRSPYRRMANVSRHLCRQLGRVHTPHELLAEYDGLKMNTGTDDDGRAAR